MHEYVQQKNVYRIYIILGRPRKVRKDHAYDRAGQEAAGSGDAPDAPQTEEQGSGDEKTKKKGTVCFLYLPLSFDSHNHSGYTY